MELTAANFRASILPSFGKARADAQNSRQLPPQTSANTQKGNGNPATGRTIIGELLDKKTEIYTLPRQSNTTQQSASSFTQAENRRFSPQAAIDMFQQNEATITDNSQSRQVSGIIDLYV